MSRFQQITIAKSKWWGITLWLDNIVNFTQSDEFVYHEMLVHVPMMVQANPKRVLIVGGGDGGCARELLKHDNLEKCVMIDIDELVISACKEHMPFVNNGAFEDERLELIIGDGIDYVAKAADESFDVIIVDGTDPIEENFSGEGLFSTRFYHDCKRVLSKDGVLSSLGMMPMRDHKEVWLNKVSK